MCEGRERGVGEIAALSCAISDMKGLVQNLRVAIWQPSKASPPPSAYIHFTGSSREWDQPRYFHLVCVTQGHPSWEEKHLKKQHQIRLKEKTFSSTKVTVRQKLCGWFWTSE